MMVRREWQIGGGFQDETPIQYMTRADVLRLDSAPDTKMTSVNFDFTLHPQPSSSFQLNNSPPFVHPDTTES